MTKKETLTHFYRQESIELLEKVVRDKGLNIETSDDIPEKRFKTANREDVQRAIFTIHLLRTTPCNRDVVYSPRPHNIPEVFKDGGWKL